MFKKKKLPQVNVPRQLEDINKELNQECWALGQLEYQIFILEKAVSEKNLKIQQLNYEGNERKLLDAQAADLAAKAKAAAEGVANAKS